MTKINRSLRDYQTDLIKKARAEIKKNFKSVMIQLATGGGKTRIVGSIINSAISRSINGKPQEVWFIVPRNNLLWQSSEEFKQWKILHGMITSKSDERSGVFQTHICSKDTLIRRIKKKLIKSWPQIIIIDEAHLALDQQLYIKEHAPKGTLFLGFTATPERADGRGLDEMYETIVFGPDLLSLVSGGHLKHPKCLSIPKPEGLDKLKFNKQGEVNAKELNLLYKAGNIYGDAIEHYRKHAIGRAFLVFCRSLLMAEDTADEFTKSGLKVELIDGTMTDKVKKDKIDRVKNGELDGLATADLLTYGLDVPKISCVILLRPTDSVALYFQMLGRASRPCPEGIYNDFLVLDHVGNCDPIFGHGHPLAPRVWQWTGRKKKPKIPKNAVERLENVQKCDICWDIIIDGVCRSCGAEKEKKSLKPLKQVEGWLVEIIGPTALGERPLENQRKYQDMIASNVDNFLNLWQSGGVIDSDAVKNLLEVASDLKRQPMWVYHKLTEGLLLVNSSLLAEISKIKEYKDGWAWNKRQDLEKMLKEKQ